MPKKKRKIKLNPEGILGGMVRRSDRMNAALLDIFPEDKPKPKKKKKKKKGK